MKDRDPQEYVGEILEMKADPNYDRMLAIFVCQAILNAFFILQFAWILARIK